MVTLGSSVGGGEEYSGVAVVPSGGGLRYDGNGEEYDRPRTAPTAPTVARAKAR